MDRSTHQNNKCSDSVLEDSFAQKEAEGHLNIQAISSQIASLHTQIQSELFKDNEDDVDYDGIETSSREIDKLIKAVETSPVYDLATARLKIDFILESLKKDVSNPAMIDYTKSKLLSVFANYVSNQNAK